MIGLKRREKGETMPRHLKEMLAGGGAFLCLLIFPALLRGQWLPREALGSFPADTQQIAYLNLAQLRTLAEYPQIRQRVLDRRLRDFQDFLRSAGTDPEKDVDEVALGWHGEDAGGARFFGLSSGRFEPQQVHDFFVKYKLRSREYAGVELYAFGLGVDRDDFFFTFLNPSLAAFGRLVDVEWLLDVRAGTRPALDSNADLVNWEAELEGTAPQWGINTGKAIVNSVAPWLTGGGKNAVDPSAVLAPVRAVLYRVDWTGGINTRVSILCKDAASATALAQLITLLRDARQAGGVAAPAAIATLVEGLDVQATDFRVELRASAPMEAVDQIMQTSGTLRTQ
jgi:hypothetical protein